MKKISNEEMKRIEGGVDFSASMLSGIYHTIEVIMNLDWEVRIHNEIFSRLV